MGQKNTTKESSGSEKKKKKKEKKNMGICESTEENNNETPQGDDRLRMRSELPQSSAPESNKTPRLTFDKSQFEAKPNEYDYLFKVLLIGDTGVGKSSILVRYSDDKFLATHSSTIGVDFKHRTIKIEEQTVKLQLWDTAGQERFRTVTNAYYRGSHGIIIVYDITHRESFQNITTWLDELKKSAPQNCVKLLVGNKSDLTSERQVTVQDAQKFAQKHDLLLIETSAKDDVNVREAFREIAQEIKSRIV